MIMQKVSDANQLNLPDYNICFHGEAVDDRGKAAVHEIEGRAKTMISLTYDPSNLDIWVSGDCVSVDELPKFLEKKLSGSIVLETTTLGFVEILLCCRALHKLGFKTYDLLYVEPKRYRNPPKRHLLRRRDFELSGNVPGYQAIPGSAILLGDRKPQKGVFFVGYEEARLRRAFEDLQMIQPSKSAIVFGIPAFKPGWEMDSIANNIAVIREQNVRGGIHFCGAENPVAVIEILTEIHASLGPDQRLFVSPIGTKPHGIGVAVFVSQHPEIGVIYDHPKRTQGRSEKMAHWHLFSVTSPKS